MFEFIFNRKIGYEKRVMEIEAMMHLIEDVEKRGSTRHIKFLRKILINCFYKDDDQINEDIKFSKKQIRKYLIEEKWSNIYEADYFEFLIIFYIGSIKPKKSKGVSHLTYLKNAPKWVIT
jgi:hypothetical protein